MVVGAGDRRVTAIGDGTWLVAESIPDLLAPTVGALRGAVADRLIGSADD